MPATFPDSDDPVLRSARREAVFTVGLWFVAATTSLTVCYRLGYARGDEPLTFLWGIPDWVFWGILVPWCGCTLASTWFAFWFMHDDPLDEADDAGPAGNTAGQ